MTIRLDSTDMMFFGLQKAQEGIMWKGISAGLQGPTCVCFWANHGRKQWKIKNMFSAWTVSFACSENGGGGDPSNSVEICNRFPYCIDVLFVMAFVGARYLKKNGHGLDSYMMSFKKIMILLEGTECPSRFKNHCLQGVQASYTIMCIDIYSWRRRWRERYIYILD